MKFFHYIKKYYLLSRIEQLLFAKCFLFSILVKILVHFLPLKFYYGYIKQTKLKYTFYFPSSDIIEIAKASIARVENIAPWKISCLEKAITFKKILNAYGVPATINCGLLIKNNKMLAHSWILLEGGLKIFEKESIEYKLVNSFE